MVYIVIYIILSGIVFLTTLVVSFIIVWIYIGRLPRNNPQQYLKSLRNMKSGEYEERNVIVFIGDSITHGRICEDYTKIVSSRLNPDDYRFVNAGINGDLTFNVLLRIRDVIQCKPDLITILLGTNDANGSLSMESAARYEKNKKVPRDPNFWEEDRFKEDLGKIILELKLKTKAKIAVISIPPLGERMETIPFKRSFEYSNVIKDVAKECNVTYLPLNEIITVLLQQNPTKSTIPFERNEITTVKAVIWHYILRRSWETISKINGFQLLTDHIHPNTTGATMIADLIVEFIVGNS